MTNHKAQNSNLYILDVYPIPHGMRVWVLDESGRAFSFLDPWSPYFYLKAKPRDRFQIEQELRRFKLPFSLRTVEKKDFFSHQSQPVLEIRVQNPLRYKAVVERFIDLSFEVFNADYPVVQAYFYDRGLFPLARCDCEADSQGRVRGWNLKDSPWILDYELPPLRYAHLGFESHYGNPNHAPGGSRGRGRLGGYVLTLGREPGKGTSYVLNESEEELVLSLNRHMQEWDPDILLSDWGDSYIMPRLQMHAARSRVPLQLSRDPRKNMNAARDHCFFSYGRMIYRAGPRTLFGRLHIDTRNSFMVTHSQLEGLFEIARVAKIPLQRAARSTIGTSLSSIQMNWAIQHDYLIPLDKGQVEAFRPADEFVASDRGGLVYEPEIGWHEDLIEYDFVSMYPEIMIRHNITPEAINCACCPDNKVPEIGHHICRHRIGMVPQTLEPIVRKRYRYKALSKTDHPKRHIFKMRSDAFKWALVTCFGYLGYRNARFGRIEAHECVNAYSREALLIAKETAEKRGFHFLHAIVDSLWVKKKGATDREINALRCEIEEKTGLPLGLEGRYRWIRFCRSRLNKRVGVPNRYYGVFTTGEIKVRGIEMRRHDTPPFLCELQQTLLSEMARAANLTELVRRKSSVAAVVQAFKDRLQAGHFLPPELAISLRIDRQPKDYIHDTLSALAAKKMESSGVTVYPGETLRFVVASEKDKVKNWRVTPLAFIEDDFEYDQRYYGRLLDRAAGISPFEEEGDADLFR